MQDNHGHPCGIAALLDIQPVAVASIKGPLIEGLDWRIEKLVCRFSTCELLH
jgi:hypothetical protein